MWRPRVADGKELFSLSCRLGKIGDHTLSTKSLPTDGAKMLRRLMDWRVISMMVRANAKYVGNYSSDACSYWRTISFRSIISNSETREPRHTSAQV